MNETTFGIVLIPSYNTGPALVRTVRDALAHWPHVWVVVDGSTDGSADDLETKIGIHQSDTGFQPSAASATSAVSAASEFEILNLKSEIPSSPLPFPSSPLPAPPGLRVIHRSANGGKGAAIQTGLEAALAEGVTHVLTLDADGQHPADHIARYFAVSREHPDALVMGRPVFGPDAPAVRVQGRKLTLFWTNLETAFCGLGDTLFGMRVYPARPLLEARRQTAFARRYDFDPEVAVRLCWQGHRPISLDTPVRYFRKDEGGVSHFHYLRDNIRLTLLHFRLVPEFLLLRWPAALRNKNRWKKLPSKHLPHV